MLERLPANAPLAEMLEVFRRDGAMVVEGMVDRDTINALRHATDRYASGVEPGRANQGMGERGKVFVGANTVRFSSLGLLTDAYFDLLENEVFGELADAVLLPHCGSYWVNTGQVMYINPGEPAQELHRDADNWWEFLNATWPNTPDITLSAMIGLDHVTEEMGATRAVPGSHLDVELEHADDLETVPAELAPGDAFIYSGNVVHGAGANRSETVRRAMHLSFVVGWLTPEEASAIDFATDELASRSPRVQRLLGHRSYDPTPHRGGGLWLRHVMPIEDQSTDSS